MSKLSPKVCPACGSVAIVRQDEMDTCTRCKTTKKTMRRLHTGISSPENRGYTRVASVKDGHISGGAYMKRPHLGSRDT